MAKEILVCGLPGVGKSTLAEEIAKSLGLPLFSKSVVREI
jgi:adenylate kinase family enzyme